jgi:uncharacterized delta-60 repeat protein
MISMNEQMSRPSIGLLKRQADLTKPARALAFCAMAILFLLSGMLIAAQAQQLAGSLDSTFGVGGKVSTQITGNEVAQAMIIQPDGKIVVGGYNVMPGVSLNFALVRYNTNGHLDTSFGAGGKVSTDFFGSSDQIQALAIQPDGKIIAAGYAYMGQTFNTADFALARYNSDGSLDESFGTGGKLTADFVDEDLINEDLAYKVVVQPDGKIIAVGSSQNQSVPNSPLSFAALVRFNSDGSLDTDFGADGKVINTFGSTYARAHAALLQPDGKIVIAGYANIPGSGSDFAIARYNTDGTPDTDFGTSGIFTHDITFSGDIGYGLARQADGKLILVGRANVANMSSDFAIARYLSNGTLDQSFDTDGKLTTDFSAGVNDWARDVAIQPDGKIVVAGYALSQITQRDFALARYETNGALDTSFDTDGRVMTDFFGLTDTANAVALQANGRIVVAGSTRNGEVTNIALARYLATNARASVPSDFDGDGKSDVAVFRPSDSGWYALLSSNNSLHAQTFGLSTDRITPGDFDGDGKTDLAVYREGVWYILQSSDNAFRAQQFGISTDVPVPADYDGDGRTDIAVYRDGAWHILQSSNQAYRAQQFGLAGDKPVRGDYDGDGKADLAVFRPTEGSWYVLQSLDGSFRAQQFGLSTDKPAQGDYDGDGRTDFAVYRPESGTWYIQQTTAGFRAEQFGIENDDITPADYDGDGKTDIAVFRAGAWYIRQSSDNLFRAEQFGTGGDRAVPSAYLP